MSIDRAIENIIEGKLDEMRTNLANVLTEKAAAKLDERKVEIAENYFGLEQLDERAKWRSNKKAIASKENPKNPGNSEQDDYYGWEAPRSTGRMRAKGDTTNSYDGLNNRHKSDVATRGDRKGKITKDSINRLKDRIVGNHFQKE
jgi:hypothetical protein